MSFLRKTVWLLGLALAGIPAHAADPLPLTAFIVDLDHASKNSMRAMPGLQQTGLAFTAMLDTAVNGDIEMTRALILAGAHRCASRSESSCSGRTRICGDGRNPYRTSDTAHNPDTRFHTAHLILTDFWPKAVVVQLHGFGVKNTDAWVVLSDTSRDRRPGDTELTGQVRDGIRAWFRKTDAR